MAVIPYRDVPGVQDPPLRCADQEVAEAYCGDLRCDCMTGLLTVGDVTLAIDVGTGRLDPVSGTGARAQQERARDALAQVVRQDGVLERLRAHYQAVRAWSAPHHYRYRDWTGLQPTDLVPYRELHQDEEAPLLPVQSREGQGPGTSILLEDAYCVDPRCDCKRAVLVVSAVTAGEGAARQLGLVGYDLRRGQPGVLQVTSLIDANSLLILVLGALRRMPELAGRYAARYAEVRQAMIPLIARQRRREKDAGKGEAKAAVKEVGRNDPCPCGSGKKYKKCHGQQVAA
jgi:hypothetical protein